MGGWYSVVEVTDKHREGYGHRDDTHAASEVYSCTNGQGMDTVIMGVVTIFWNKILIWLKCKIFYAEIWHFKK